MKNMWWQVIPSSNGCVCLRASSLGVDLKLNGPLTKLVLQGCYCLNYGLATQVHDAKLPLSTSKWDGVSSKTRGSQNLHNACQTVTRPSLRSTEIESAEIFRWRFSGTIDSYDSHRKSEKKLNSKERMWLLPKVRGFLLFCHWCKIVFPSPRRKALFS